MPLTVHDGEGLLLLDLAVAKRPHLKCVERDSFALRELGGVAERRVQGGRGHAESIGCFASQSTIAVGALIELPEKSKDKRAPPPEAGRAES